MKAQLFLINYGSANYHVPKDCQYLIKGSLELDLHTRSTQSNHHKTDGVGGGLALHFYVLLKKDSICSMSAIEAGKHRKNIHCNLEQ